MKSKYGNVQRSISTVRSNFASSARNPGANSSTRSGATMIPTTVTSARKEASVPAAPSTRSRTSSWVLRTLYSETTGTKACENAPSANRRRMKFGILNATRNASMSTPAPNIREYTMSRASPVIRDRSVKPPTIEVLRRKPLTRGVSKGDGGARAGGASCGADYTQPARRGAVRARDKRLRLTVGGRIARIRGSFEPAPSQSPGSAGVSTRGEYQVRRKARKAGRAAPRPQHGGPLASARLHPQGADGDPGW